MSKDWPYSRLSKMAKKNGGPEKLIKKVANTNLEKGIKEGMKKGFEEGVKSRNKDVAIACIAGGTIASVVTFFVTRKKTREKVEEEYEGYYDETDEAEEAEEELLRQYEELQCGYEELQELLNEKSLQEVHDYSIEE